MEFEIGEPETCTDIAPRSTRRTSCFAGHETIEIHMHQKIITSLVGMMMLIGSPLLAEGSNYKTGKDAETADTVSSETDKVEDVSDKSDGADNVESSSADTLENAEVIGDIAIGEELYKDTCKNCHGPKAKGMASFPKLAGHEAEYLVERLTTYRAGEKVGPNTALMAPMAADLSDEDIASLAIYISETFE